MPDSPALLVPISVEALLVNDPVRNGVTFLRWSNDWTQLANYTDPIPPPRVSVDPPKVPTGVYLHWTLPAALTHGKATTDGTTEFPSLPNRWLVVRSTSTQQSTTAPASTAWIVESDYSGDDGAVSWVDGSSTPTNLKFTRIGRSVDLRTWKESGGAATLKATGIADVTFTAYQPGVTNVFGFYDPMTGVAENANVTYLVAGWYGRAGDDPLATQTPFALNWMVLGANDQQAAPPVSVYHGLVVDLTWQTTTQPPRRDSDGTSLQIGVANTSIDALAAIVAARAHAQDPSRDVSDLILKLEAFQYGVLDTLKEPDAGAQLELKIRDAWFGRSPGGTVWTLAPLGQGQTTTAPLGRDVQPTAATPTQAQQEWLAALNAQQRESDTAQRALVSAQTQLFGLWWKAQRIPKLGVGEVLEQNRNGIDILALGEALPAQLDPAQASSFASEVVAAQQRVAALALTVPNPAQSDPAKPDSPQTWSAKIPGYDPKVGPVLRAQALPGFVQPVDPVVLVAGLSTPPAAPADGPLPCRLSNAAVTGASVGTTAVTAAMAAQLITSPVATLGNNVSAAVAAALSALVVETFFADPNEATAIAGLAGVTTPAEIAQLRAALTAGTAQTATISNPLRAQFAFALWQQAWSPLYLEWNLTWKPSVDFAAPVGEVLPPPPFQWSDHAGGAQDNWSFASDAWTFDGGDHVTERGSEYYTWAAAGDLAGWAKYLRQYIGRTFLTPQTTSLFLKRIREYVAVHPDADLSTVLELIGQTNFLSQSLGGFNQHFITQTAMQAVPPFGDATLVNAIGDEVRAIPDASLGDGDYDYGKGVPYFMPLRGGYFQFEQLRIVDRFGQVLDLTQGNGNPGDATNFAPICGAGVAPEPNLPLTAPRRLVKQAPRLVQPARLDLRMLDAADDAKEIGYAAGANPICGWFLPNHLDRAIAVYDASGRPLGELLVLAQTGRSPAVRWLPAPKSPVAISDPAQIANPHLRDACTAFTAATGGIPVADRVAAFRALYASIDETLGMIDPAGGQGDADLAVLIGRPLALVRAQVQFELGGAPVYNLSWRDTLDLADPDDPSTVRAGRQDAGFTTIPLPIALGSVELLDDGLVGYYTSDDYKRFSAVHASTQATSPHVVPIVPDNYLALPFDYPTYSTTTLSLLLDPRGTVHATTGILPTATMTVPPAFFADALAQMGVTFRIGPLLTDPAAVRLPIPAQHSGTWSWVHVTAPGPQYAEDGIIAADARARLPATPPNLVDGWLKFTPQEKSSS